CAGATPSASPAARAGVGGAARAHKGLIGAVRRSAGHSATTVSRAASRGGACTLIVPLLFVLFFFLFIHVAHGAHTGPESGIMRQHFMGEEGPVDALNNAERARRA